jgi:hypothetical protein
MKGEQPGSQKWRHSGGGQLLRKVIGDEYRQDVDNDLD